MMSQPHAPLGLWSRLRRLSAALPITAAACLAVADQPAPQTAKPRPTKVAGGAARAARLFSESADTSELPAPPRRETIAKRDVTKTVLKRSASGHMIVQAVQQQEELPAPPAEEAPVKSADQVTPPGDPASVPKSPEGVTTPPAPVSQLRAISAIKPYYDYDPDGKACDHLCPKPGNCPDDPGAECPEEVPFIASYSQGRFFPETHYHWTASNLMSNPLYFQDVPLERYGHVKCNEFVQPFVSLTKFGIQLGGLPYQMALDCPHSYRYALGYYRPGDCAPHLCYQVPLNARAAVTAALVYTGIAFIQ